MKYLTFDTETTGLDTAKDQIIEISVQIGLGKKTEIKTRRIKPTVPISKDAEAVHGISMNDLKDEPTFRQIGKGLRELFEDAEAIIGYNVAFDLQILQSELIRNEIEPLDLKSKHVLDPLSIWRHFKPRRLESAYMEFCGKELKDAHSAEADTIATAEIFTAMTKAFSLEETPIKELSEISMPSDWVGISHHIKWRGVTPVFAFGKGKDKSVWEYLNDNPDYLSWMKRANFLPHIIDICDAAVSMKHKTFADWVKTHY